jgi:hypothetical protein
VLIVKHNSTSHNYILLGNDWFYGRNNDGDQVYLAEIVADAEDVWVRTTLRIKDLVGGEKRAVMRERAYNFWDSESSASAESFASADSSNEYSVNFVKCSHKQYYCTAER